MTAFAKEQETDSITPLAVHDYLTFPSELHPSEEITGDSTYSRYLPLLGKSEILGEGWSVLRSINNKDVAKDCENVLATIQELLINVQQDRLDIWDMPRLRAFVHDDGSVLLEWIFCDYRIGFTLEPDPNESGWYLVSNRRMGDVTASGSLARVNRKAIISWLFTFVLYNS